jgi:hypothetical protein
MNVGGVASLGLGRPVGTEASQGASLHGAAETARIRQDVAAARDVARSALTNERFRLMLEQIVTPALSDVLVQMKNDGSQTDLRTAQQSYSEVSSS